MKKNHFIDFRSDTVTLPTKEMLQFLKECSFGDDVFQEDETVNKLEKICAELFGKEKALYVCTGTMGNQVSVMSLLSDFGPTHGVIMDKRSHIYEFELGGLSFHTGCRHDTIIPKNGKYITCQEIKENLILKNDWHHPITKLVTLENTIQGVVMPIEEIKAIRELCDEHKILMHLDGARIWNASVASGVSLKEYGKYFDTMNVCLSKGLGAPIGSVIVGNEKIIQKARRFRKLTGGGWRQAGIIAAPAIYAIKNNLPKLGIDHENAKFLSGELKKLGFEVVNDVQTNWVVSSSKSMKVSWKLISSHKLILENNIRLTIRGGDENLTRMLTHIQISQKDIEKFISILKKIIKETADRKN